MLKSIDLFAGCGGLSLGFKNAGFRVAAAFDNWEPAIKVYEGNFPHHKIYDLDLSETKKVVKIAKLYDVDLLLGGPPCQDFSSAGKRNENLGRANLTIAFAEIVCSLKCRYFVMENVERIIKSRALKVAMNLFRSTGYGLTAKMLDASLCGVPQKRKRFFLVGELRGKDDFLLPYLTANLASKPMTVRQYLGNSLGVQHYYRHPRSYLRRAVFSIDEPSPTVRGVNRPIPPNYKPHPGDKLTQLKSIRPLTTVERSYIQTFPKGFRFVGSKTDLEQIIGNAVPVKLAEYVAQCLKTYIADKNGHLKR